MNLKALLEEQLEIEEKTLSFFIPPEDYPDLIRETNASIQALKDQLKELEMTEFILGDNHD